MQVLGDAQVVLIDLPDYSKTDMRRVSSDLQSIYWVWNEFSSRLLEDPPSYVISFQKEMFRGHYFLGKMNRINLKPLNPERLVEAYKKSFPDASVFEDEAVLLLARMSRGIFRRFLRYITLTIDHKERIGSAFPVTVEQAREAIPLQLLAQDMDDQLAEIFPRQPELRSEAVRLLLHLGEHGPTEQAEISELLSIRDYAVSRLLNKLENHGYLKRKKDGVENIVSLVVQQAHSYVLSNQEIELQ